MAVLAEERTYWWDAGAPAGATVEPLEAVIFDLDALADADVLEESAFAGDVAPRAGVDDLVNSLYFAGVSVAVVSTGAPGWVDPLVRQLVGDGIAETIVTPDDLRRPASTPDLHGHALWQLGLPPERGLAVAAHAGGLRAARAAKLATMAVAKGYDGMLSGDLAAVHRRWWAGR